MSYTFFYYFGSRDETCLLLMHTFDFKEHWKHPHQRTKKGSTPKAKQEVRVLNNRVRNKSRLQRTKHLHEARVDSDVTAVTRSRPVLHLQHARRLFIVPRLHTNQADRAQLKPTPSNLFLRAVTQRKPRVPQHLVRQQNRHYEPHRSGFPFQPCLWRVLGLCLHQIRRSGADVFRHGQKLRFLSVRA